jgi:hypothetical protein
MSFAGSFEVCTVMDAAHSKATNQQRHSHSPLQWPVLYCRLRKNVVSHALDIRKIDRASTDFRSFAGQCPVSDRENCGQPPTFAGQRQHATLLF